MKQMLDSRITRGTFSLRRLGADGLDGLEPIPLAAS
jgi:hypothetical protein